MSLRPARSSQAYAESWVYQHIVYVERGYLQSVQAAFQRGQISTHVGLGILVIDPVDCKGFIVINCKVILPLNLFWIPSDRIQMMLPFRIRLGRPGDVGGDAKNRFDFVG